MDNLESKDSNKSTEKNTGENSSPNFQEIEDTSDNFNQKSNLLKKLINLDYFNFIFESKLKYFLFATFLIYLVFNLTVCLAMSKTELPIVSIIPQESFLRKHMINHLELFNIGPIIIIAFLKPLDYWNINTFNRIRLFLNDAKQIQGVDNLFEMNWLQDTYYHAKTKANFNEKCRPNPLNYECFHEALEETMGGYDLYTDDVVYTPKANISEFVQINSSRFYLSMSNFYGKLDEVEMMYKLKWLAESKYNFSKDEIVIYSAVDVFLEQLDQINSSVSTIMLLSIESIILISFLVLFDLKSIFILSVILISCLLAILANMFLFGMSLNIVVLTHFLMVPAFLGDFFLYWIFIFMQSGS